MYFRVHEIQIVWDKMKMIISTERHESLTPLGKMSSLNRQTNSSGPNNLGSIEITRFTDS